MMQEIMFKDHYNRQEQLVDFYTNEDLCKELNRLESVRLDKSLLKKNVAFLIMRDYFNLMLYAALSGKIVKMNKDGNPFLYCFVQKEDMIGDAPENYNSKYKKVKKYQERYEIDCPHFFKFHIFVKTLHNLAEVRVNRTWIARLYNLLKQNKRNENDYKTFDISQVYSS